MPVELSDVADDKWLFDVNYLGAKALAKAMLPQLRASKGRLVFISSMAGHVAAPFGQPYSASKFAVRSLADSMRGELRPSGVSVSRVDPGFINTPILGPVKGGQSDGWFGFEKFGALPKEIKEPYESHFHEFSAKMSRSAFKASTTSSTDKAVVHAFTAAKPQAAYHPGTVAGLPASAAVALSSILGAIDPAWQDLAAALS